MLNFVAVKFHKMELLDALYRDAERHLALMRAKDDYRLPAYIRVSEVPLAGKDLVLFKPSFEGRFVFLDLSVLKRKLRNFALSLLLWEAFLILSLSYLFYKLLWYHLRERERNREFLELMLLVLSHRLGNFLAAQRVNLEILKEDRSPTALGRLERALGYIEDQFRRSLQLIRSLPTRLEREEVELSELLQQVLKSFQGELEGKRVELDLEEVRVRGSRSDLEMMLHLFFENAAKYSRSYIRTSFREEGQEVVLEVENDIAPGVTPGSGLGLELARRLGERMGVKVGVCREGDRFFQRASFRKKRLLLP